MQRNFLTSCYRNIIDWSPYLLNDKDYVIEELIREINESFIRG